MLVRERVTLPPSSPPAKNHPSVGRTQVAVEPGDVIVSVGGTPIEGLQEGTLRGLLSSGGPGSKVDVVVRKKTG